MDGAVKRCSRCGETKPEDDFHWMTKPTRRMSYCKACRARVDRGNKLKSLYGITLEQYELLLRLQEGSCAICNTPPEPGKNLVVDHDHACCPGGRSCGRCLRGLLCHSCNLSIGTMRDSTLLMLSAIDYIEQGSLDIWLLLHREGDGDACTDE